MELVRRKQLEQRDKRAILRFRHFELARCSRGTPTAEARPDTVGKMGSGYSSRARPGICIAGDPWT